MTQLVPTVVWLPKLGAVLVGFIPIAIGVGLLRFGAPLIISLNRLYAQLPGRFRYPEWWRRLLGVIFVGLGLLIAVTGVLFAGR